MGILDGQLAQAVYAGFKGKLKTGLIRQEIAPASGALDGNGDPIDVSPVFTKIEGFTDQYSAFYKAQAGIPDTDLKVCWFAKSAPGVTPGRDDKIKIGATWYQVRDYRVDPATALWECQSFEIEPPADAP